MWHLRLAVFTALAFSLGACSARVSDDGGSGSGGGGGGGGGGVSGGGCEGTSGGTRARPFCDKSPWNTPTPADAKWYDLDLLHTIPVCNNGESCPRWLYPCATKQYWATSQDPLWMFNMTAFSDPVRHRYGEAVTFQLNAPDVIGTEVGPLDDGDHDLLLANEDTGDIIEIWHADVDLATRTVNCPYLNCSWKRSNLKTDPGAGTPEGMDGVRASNFSMFGGVITGADLAAKKIDHALVVAIGYELLMAGGNAQPCAWGQLVDPADALSACRYPDQGPAYRWPALAWDNSGAYGPIPMGSKIGIPLDYPKPDGLSAIGSMLFDALKEYGMYVGDNGVVVALLISYDSGSVTEDEVNDIFYSWPLIMPALRIADYQPGDCLTGPTCPHP